MVEIDFSIKTTIGNRIVKKPETLDKIVAMLNQFKKVNNEFRYSVFKRTIKNKKVIASEQIKEVYDYE